MPNQSRMHKRCAIVGAGASGLACARWALAYDVEPVVFERMGELGGLWLYKSDIVKDGYLFYSYCFLSCGSRNFVGI